MQVYYLTEGLETEYRIVLCFLHNFNYNTWKTVEYKLPLIILCQILLSNLLTTPWANPIPFWSVSVIKII